MKFFVHSMMMLEENERMIRKNAAQRSLMEIYDRVQKGPAIEMTNTQICDKGSAHLNFAREFEATMRK